MKRALITGISGFVGPYLAKQLLSDGFQVSGLVRSRSMRGNPERLLRLGIASSVELYDGDITDLTSLLDALDQSRPDFLFHLAAQSFVPRSFMNPLETFRVNTFGTANVLESVRVKQRNCRIIFAGSSEEFGLQLASQAAHTQAIHKYHVVHPRPAQFPELPVNEENPLRPLSPYALSKVQGDHLTQNYHYSYGMDTLVSRAFNHEGAGRGHQFVTASIVSQCIRLMQGEVNSIVLGNVNAFRDWSHVLDIVDGYILLAAKGNTGDVYVQGSMRMHSVLSYLLITLDELGYQIESVETEAREKRLEYPLQEITACRFGVTWPSTKLDDAMFAGLLQFEARDRGLLIRTSRGNVSVAFDAGRFRPADVPVLLSDIRKIQALGFRVRRSLRDIIRDQINYYFDFRNQASPILEKSHA